MGTLLGISPPCPHYIPTKSLEELPFPLKCVHFIAFELAHAVGRSLPCLIVSLGASHTPDSQSCCNTAEKLPIIIVTHC